MGQWQPRRGPGAREGGRGGGGPMHKAPAPGWPALPLPRAVSAPAGRGCARAPAAQFLSRFRPAAARRTKDGSPSPHRPGPHSIRTSVGRMSHTTPRARRAAASERAGVGGGRGAQHTHSRGAAAITGGPWTRVPPKAPGPAHPAYPRQGTAPGCDGLPAHRGARIGGRGGAGRRNPSLTPAVEVQGAGVRGSPARPGRSPNLRPSADSTPQNAQQHSPSWASMTTLIDFCHGIDATRRAKKSGAAWRERGKRRRARKEKAGERRKTRPPPAPPAARPGSRRVSPHHHHHPIRWAAPRPTGQPPHPVHSDR